VTWQPPVRSFACNLQQSKDLSGLAGGTSSDAQISRKSERERMIILDGIHTS
jgi:hypothetical protein